MIDDNLNTENSTQPDGAQTEERAVEDLAPLHNVLKEKNFLLLFLNTLVTNIGVTLYSFAASYYILDITSVNATIQGTYLAVGGIVFLVLSPLGGVLADRWNKVRIIYLGDMIKGVAILVSAVLIFIGRSNGDTTIQLIALFAVGIINYAIASIFSPASTALIPKLVGKNRLQQANSYFSILSSLQSIFGILLAGVLYSVLPITVLFAVVGLCYLASGVSETFIRCVHVKNPDGLTVKKVFSNFADGFRFLKTQKGIVAVILCALLINFFLTPYFSNGKPYFTKIYVTGDYLFNSFMTGEMWYSVASMFNGVGSLLAGILLGAKVQSKRQGRNMKMWLCVMVAFIVLDTVSFWIFAEIGISLSAYLLISCAVMFALGFSVVFINIPLFTIIQTRVPEDKLAKVSSLVNIGSQGLTPIASMLGGLVLSGISFSADAEPQGWGLLTLLIICSAGLAACALIFVFNRKIDQL